MNLLVTWSNAANGDFRVDGDFIAKTASESNYGIMYENNFGVLVSNKQKKIEKPFLALYVCVVYVCLTN